MSAENNTMFSVNFEPKKVFQLLLSVNADKLNSCKKAEKSAKKKIDKVHALRDTYIKNRDKIKQLKYSYDKNGTLTPEELVEFENFKQQFGLKNSQ